MTISPPSAPKSASDRDLGRGFRFSLVLHVGLALFALIKGVVFPGNPVPMIPTLRVDIVGLPDQLKREVVKIQNVPPAHAPAAPPKKSEPKHSKPVELAKPDEMVLKPKREKVAKESKDRKNREKKLLSSLNRIRAIEKISSDVEKSRPRESASATLLKGNKISKGSSALGEVRETDEAGYYDSIRDRLQSNWELPVWIARQNLSAQVQLYLDNRGRVRSFRFVRSSGNPQFDDAIKKAIGQSDPFVPPPSAVASSVLVDGILVGFPL